MYAIIDIESSGGQYNEEGITEIAIYRHDGHQIVDQFSSLVNPERNIDPYVVKLTGINNKMLAKAPKFYELAKRIVEITENAVLVAHNAQFDYRILKLEFDRLGYPFEIKTLCTVELSQKLLPDAESHSLGKLVRSLGIPITDRHRATGDALATVKLFELLLEKDKAKKIIQSSLKYIKIKQVTSDLKDILDTLPTSTGVFYLYDDQDEIILIGQARNIKKQVNKLFLSKTRKAQVITKSTVRATYEKTGNELIAGIKEKLEIAEKLPKYNKRQGKGRKFYPILRTSDNRLIVPVKRGEGTVLTTFTSRAAATSYFDRLELDKLDEDAIAKLFKKISIDNRSCLIKLRGRRSSEKGIVAIENGSVVGYAFTDLKIQTSDQAILKNIMITVQPTNELNHTVSTYLRSRNDYQIQDVVF